MGKGPVDAVWVVAGVAEDLDLASLTGEGINDRLEARFLAFGCGVASAAVGAAHGLVRWLRCRPKEYTLESSRQG